MTTKLTPARILVAIDGSRPSLGACRYAVELAGRLGATLVALHVAVPYVPRSSIGITPQTARQDEDAARAYGEATLAQARNIAGGLVPLTTELIFGDPAEVICQRARELDVDLIILGSRGLGAVDRVLWGSVSSAVAQRAPCAVLVTREREPDTS